MSNSVDQGGRTQHTLQSVFVCVHLFSRNNALTTTVLQLYQKIHCNWKWWGSRRVSIVAQLVKPLPMTPTIPSDCWSSSAPLPIQLPVHGSEKAVGDATVLVPVTHVGDLNGAPGFWFLWGPELATVAIWTENQQTQDHTIPSSFCNPVFQIYKSFIIIIIITLHYVTQCF